MSGTNQTAHVLDNLFRDNQRESLEQQQAYEAQARYESMVVQEARAIVGERINLPPTKEHLRVLLEWLDGTRVRLKQAQPEIEQGENTPPF
jgi:hypothetical protein